MRTLLVPSSYSPHVGGVEEVVARIGERWSQDGDRVAVLTNRWPRDLPEYELLDDIEVRRARFRVPHRSIRGTASWLLCAQRTRRQLCKWAQDFSPDVINLHCVSTNLAYAEAVALACNVPLVVSLHGELGNDATGLYRNNPQFLGKWRRGLCVADAITAPSQFVLEEAQVVYGRDFGAKARVIPNGVDMTLFSPVHPTAKGRPFVLAVGRLVPPKGFDRLISAWAQVRSESGAELVIAGSGPERANLETLALQCPGTIRFVGELSRAQVAEYMSRATAFVLPSLAEPLGLVVLEAMAAGVPVIATLGGGVPEIARPEHCLLVPPGDVQALTVAIFETLQNRGEATARATRAAYFVRDFTWERCADSYRNAFEQAGASERRET